MKQSTVRKLVADIVATTSQWDHVKDARTVKVALPESQKKDDGRAQGVGAIRIRLRDMRLLDYNTNPNSSFSIVVRRHSVLISLDPIRAVVMADRVVLMVPSGGMDNILSTLGGFMATWSTVDGGNGGVGDFVVGGGATTKHPQMEVTRSSATRGGSGGQASSAGAVDESDVHLFDADKEDKDDDGPGASATWFEYHAYEAIFTTLNTLHAQQFKSLQEDADFVLQYFKQAGAVIIPQDVQERFQMLKTDLDVFVNRIKSYHRALSTLTEDDEAMALMNLSILKEAPWYYNAPLRREILACHDEVEELLESYLIETTSVLVRAENLVVKVRLFPVCY
jgi:magnesium transporter